MQVAIIDYGAGNVQSVKFALQRLGAEALLTDDAEVIRKSEKVIFPGVGEASSAMKALKQKELDSVIKTLKQPVLGICLGMQLMCKHSEEGDTEGLGIFSCLVKKFADDGSGFKIPHIGWNRIYNNKTELLKGAGEMPFVYFVHSYYAEFANETISTCNYIQPFSAGLQKDNFYALQFHPEKSGATGELILKNFLNL